MYIKRDGLVDNYGIRHTIKEMFFDIESVLLIMAKDTNRIIRDFFEDGSRIVEKAIDLRWNIFIYRMQSSGVLAEDIKFSKPASALYSVLSFMLGM